MAHDFTSLCALGQMEAGPDKAKHGGVLKHTQNRYVKGSHVLLHSMFIFTLDSQQQRIWTRLDGHQQKNANENVV